MDSNRIEELLQKYWNCETSLEEEEQLRVYFQADVPEHLEKTASLFRYFETQKNKSLHDAAFDTIVRDKLTVSKTGRLLYNSLRIAAGVAVLIVAGWFVRREIEDAKPVEPVAVDTYDDPKLAFEETKKALLLISSSFEKAEEQAKKINLFNEAQQEVKPKAR